MDLRDLDPLHASLPQRLEQAPRPPLQHLAAPVAGQAAAWQLDLMGRVQLRSAHTHVTRWPSRAVAALAARLALAPDRTHPREELIELLWPGVELIKGRQRLRQALSLLRGLLKQGRDPTPEVLLADRLSVRLNPQTLACDVLQLQKHLARGNWAHAQALHVGELMPGYYDDWIVAERHRMVALCEGLQPAAAALSGTSAAASGGQIGPAGAGSSATAAPPAAVRVPSASPLLPAYWTRAFGQQAWLRRLLHSVARHRLVTIIGPGGQGKTRLAVAAAAQAAMSTQFTSVVFVPLADAHTAPEVWRALAQSLDLAPGADLARRVPAHLAQMSVNRSAPVSTQPLADPPVHPPAPPSLHPSLLLVLDNLEQLDPSASECLTLLLQSSPGVHLLLTSRRRLGLAGEHLFEMPTLPVPPAGAVLSTAPGSGTGSADTPDAGLAAEQAAEGATALIHNPALALFVDRARESRPEFHLTAHNADAVVDLVRLLGGMPLAIELAASRLRALQPRELLRRLREDFGSPMLDLLSRPGAAAGPDARHASMRHVVAWSWQQLPAEVRELLRAMSVFSAPATLQAVAQAMAGLRSCPQPGPQAKAGKLNTRTARLAADAAAPALAQVQAWLADAVEASMVHVLWPASPPQAPSATSDRLTTRLFARNTAQNSAAAVDEGSRYTLLPPVREYAAEQCSAIQQGSVRGRLRRWLAELARQGLPKHRLALQDELQHAWSLLRQARQDEAPAEALALTVALKGEWNWQSLAPELLAVNAWSLSEHDPDARQLLLSQGHYQMACSRQLRAESARAAEHASLALSSAPEGVSRALALSLTCWIDQERGVAPDVVQPRLDEAVALARQGHDKHALALILRLQAAQALYHRGRPAEAEPLLLESIHLFQQAGDVAQVAMRQAELAWCWAQRGRREEALNLLAHCASSEAAIKGSPAMIYILSLQGPVLLQLRQAQAASRALTQAVQIALQYDWLALVLPALLPLPQAWLFSDQPLPAARLLGHLLASWPSTLGQFNTMQWRSIRRTRRLLLRQLGSPRLAELMRQGGQMSRDAALQLVLEMPDASGADSS